jgi:hypothetical protein
MTPTASNPVGFAARSRWSRSASDDTTGTERTRCAFASRQGCQRRDRQPRAAIPAGIGEIDLRVGPGVSLRSTPGYAPRSLPGSAHLSLVTCHLSLATILTPTPWG